MAISFTNTQGVGYQFNSTTSGSGTTNIPTIATPSDAANGTLLIALWGANIITQTPSLPNVTGETLIQAAQTFAGASQNLCSHPFVAALTGSPTNLNFNEGTGGSRRVSALALILSGHDTGSPIRASAWNTGTGTTVTFPDTASVNDGDLILRHCIVGHGDVTVTFSSFSGSTTIVSDPQSGQFKNGQFLGSSVKSGGGAPGTATLTLNSSFDWISQTIVIAAAAAGDGGNANLFGGKFGGLLRGKL